MITKVKPIAHQYTVDLNDFFRNCKIFSRKSLSGKYTRPKRLKIEVKKKGTKRVKLFGPETTRRPRGLMRGKPRALPDWNSRCLFLEWTDRFIVSDVFVFAHLESRQFLRQTTDQLISIYLSSSLSPRLYALFTCIFYRSIRIHMRMFNKSLRCKVEAL